MCADLPVESQPLLACQRRELACYPLVEINAPRAWLDKSPYQSQEVIDRWKEDLVAVGAIETV